jgi:hypothetical protein
MVTLTHKQLRNRFFWTTVFGLTGVTGMVALAAEEASATQTFLSVAEKFGIFAALSLSLVFCAVIGIWRLSQYVINTLQSVVDDNTMAFNRFARLMERRPCITDSDVDQIISKRVGPEDSDDAIVRRVQTRQRGRKPVD